MTDFTLTAGESVDTTSHGYLSGVYGSLDSNTLLGGTITDLHTYQDALHTVLYTDLVVSGSHLQDAFTSLAVGANTVNTVDAFYIVGGGVTTWEWTAVNLFPTVGNYVVSTIGDALPVPVSEPTGSVTAVAGTGTITHADTTIAPLVQNAALAVGDIITIGAGATTTLTMGDGTLFTCQSNTRFAIEAFNYIIGTPATGNLIVRVLIGIARVVTGVLSLGVFTIYSPQGSFGPRGTDFTVTVTASGTMVAVHSGSVTESSGGQTYTISAGQSMMFPVGAPPVLLGESWTSQPLAVGKYQVVVTYLRNDGQESGAGRAVTVELAAPGGIALTSIPVSADPTVTHKAIYMTAVGGETFFRVGVIDNSITVFAISEVRMGASPLLTFALSPPPAGDFIGYWKGWVLVAKGDRLYPSEAYAPELFDLRKSIPFGDRITMVAPLDNKSSGVWIGTDSRIIFLQGDAPEKWEYKGVADYGVIPYAIRFADGELLGDGSKAGTVVVFFASKRGLCVGTSDGTLINLTQARFAYPSMNTGAMVVRRHNGMAQCVCTLQGTEVAGNVFT